MNKKIFQPIFIILALLISSNSAAVKNAAILEFSDVRELSFRYDGLVSKLHVKQGDLVKKGDLLVQMDSDIIKLEIAKAEAELASVNADYTEVKQDHERALELFDREILSQVEMDKSFNTLNKSKGLNDSKLESLNILKKKKTYYSIKAPYDGIVLLNQFYPGKLISKDQEGLTSIKIAAQNQINFTLKKNSALSKNAINVSVKNKKYKALPLGHYYESSKFYNVYQINSRKAHLLVGKEVRFTLK